MRSALRHALEDDKPDETPVIVTGPLSTAFTDTLQQLYAKDQNGQTSLESQSQDDDVLRTLAHYLAPGDQAPDNAITVYGVARSEVSDEAIIEITQELADTKTEDRENFVVVLDGTNDDGQEPSVNLVAMETIMKAYGCKVFPSLEAFAEARYG